MMLLNHIDGAFFVMTVGFVSIPNQLLKAGSLIVDP